MSNCEKAFSGWARIQGLTSQRLRPRRRKQSTAIQTEALEDRVMLSAVLGSVDTQAVDLGGNLPTFSEFDAGESSMATVDTSRYEEVVNSQKNDWVIVGNPSLQEQPDADGFWHCGDGPPVTELSNQIDADSGENINQLGDIKGNVPAWVTQTSDPQDSLRLASNPT